MHLPLIDPESHGGQSMESPSSIRDQFDPYFIRLQTIEPNTIRSEVAGTRWYSGDTLFCFDH